jgi:signal transduction histidine kinase
MGRHKMNDATIESGSSSAASSIVHDLRNPLATIHTGAELLVRTRLTQPQLDRIARNIFCAAVRMRELLEEFLDRSRVEEKEVSDVRELITNAVDRIEVSADFQSVRILQAVPEGLLVNLDRHRMQRVLTNLLVNALEVMPSGGTICISAVSDGSSVVFRVRDTGPGIAPEMRDRLFQPFATSGKTNGVGLGLAFSRQAVIDNGGEMWVEPSSRGACFAFRLPRTLANDTPPHAEARCSKIRRMGGAERNDSLRGSPESKESATLMMSS